MGPIFEIFKTNVIKRPFVILSPSALVTYLGSHHSNLSHEEQLLQARLFIEWFGL